MSLVGDLGFEPSPLPYQSNAPKPCTPISNIYTFHCISGICWNRTSLRRLTVCSLNRWTISPNYMCGTPIVERNIKALPISCCRHLLSRTFNVRRGIDMRRIVQAIARWSEWRDSNPRRHAPKARALPTGPHSVISLNYRYTYFLYLYLSPMWYII